MLIVPDVDVGDQGGGGRTLPADEYCARTCSMQEVDVDGGVFGQCPVGCEAGSKDCFVERETYMTGQAVKPDCSMPRTTNARNPDPT